MFVTVTDMWLRKDGAAAILEGFDHYRQTGVDGSQGGGVLLFVRSVSHLRRHSKCAGPPALHLSRQDSFGHSLHLQRILAGQGGRRCRS